MKKYYHISKREIRAGANLTQSIYGERIIDARTVEADYNLYIKEKIFEDVRLQHFPEAPSRLNCVFLYDSIETARFYWATAYSYQAYLYEVEIKKGTPFTAEMDLLNCDGKRYTLLKKNAHKYWNQIFHPNSHTLESLLDGKATVKKLIEAPSKIW
ncbi:MAG: DUF2441 domain-containing protein [Saprospiraceae bacterium]